MNGSNDAQRCYKQTYKQTYRINNMKTKIISKILLILALVFVLGNTITPLHGGTQPSSISPIGPPDQEFPIVTIHSVTASASTFSGGTAVVARGQTGAFVLSSKAQSPLAATFVNFSVSGTAVSGVDYVPLVSPAFIGASGFGVILVKTLPDPRASAFRQAQSVVVTLEPGPGYALGQPSSAEIIIKP
jgi:hypothetical protein